MIAPNEQARQLVDKFLPYVDWSDLQKDFTNGDWAIRNSKRCALIAVEFAKENPLNTDGYNKYLQEVEQEIEKL
jgi:hypothetical protein